MKITNAMCLTALVLCAASPASGETDDYARRGLYAGVGGAYVIEQFDLPDATYAGVESSTTHFDVDSGDSWGAEARVGYRFHRNFAAEGQLQYYDNFGIDVAGSPREASPAVGPDKSPRFEFLTLNGLSLTGNVKGYPFTGRVQPYGLVGIGLLWIHAQPRRTRFDDLGTGYDDHNVGLAGRIGVGVDGYLTQNLLLNVEMSYLLPTGDVGHFWMIPISLGVQYRFD